MKVLNKVWKEEEVRQLEESIGHHKIKTIAKNLDRSYQSVIVKMNRLGLAIRKYKQGM